MKPITVEIVLLIDASESMRPCFDGLRQHLNGLLSPLRQANFKVRFGLVAYAAGRDRSGPVYDHTFVGGSGPQMIRKLYSGQGQPTDYFTEDPSQIMRVLGGLAPQGNEDTLLALDIAADFPFGPAEATRRVIALFTDEKLEDGIAGEAPIAKLPDLVMKLQQRRIQLFAAAPFSDGLEVLATVDRAEIEPVEGGDGLKSLDFKKLLAQMGKSISIASLQLGREPSWKKAIFGQDRWAVDRSVSEASRHVFLAVGESAQLDTRQPITWINVKLKWTAEVDLDLHAFFRKRSGEDGSVYFGNKREPHIRLDTDAGVGNEGGNNEENIRIDSLTDLQEILFATKIFSKGGSYADYDGRVTVETNNGDSIVVPLTAQKHADWCVIAKIANKAQDGPTVTNVNRATNDGPDLDAY